MDDYRSDYYDDWLPDADERHEFADELLRTTQVLRKNMIGNEARALLNWAGEEAGIKMDDELTEKYLAKMYPWIWGPQGIAPALVRLALREEPPTGAEVYNLLVVAHYADKSGAIQKAYETYSGKSLPKPNVMLSTLGV